MPSNAGANPKGVMHMSVSSIAESNINGQVSSEQVNAKATYDGKKLKLDINENKDGKKKSIHKTLKNDEILKMASKNTINKPIDERLMLDYGNLKPISFAQQVQLLEQQQQQPSLKKTKSSRKSRGKKRRTSKRNRKSRAKKH